MAPAANHSQEKYFIPSQQPSAVFVRLTVPSPVAHLGDIPAARTHPFTDAAILLRQLALACDLLWVLIELRGSQSPAVSRSGQERCARRSVRRLTNGNTEAEGAAKKADTLGRVSVQSRPEIQSDNRRTRVATPFLPTEPQSLSKVLQTNIWSTHDAGCLRV
jgi:hypothetical protein